MDFTLLRCSSALLGAAIVCACSASASSSDPFSPSSASAPVSATDIGSSFANFCRENPSAPAPVGAQPVWLEYFITEVDGDQPAMDHMDLPAAAMVAQGKGMWGFVEARTNSSASGGSVYTMERAPDKRLLEAGERREIGTSVYVHFFPAAGDVALQVRNTKFEGWVDPNGGSSASQSVQPIYSSREITTKLTLGSEWICEGGLTRQQVSHLANGAEQVKKVSLMMFFRLPAEKPAEVPKMIHLSWQLPR